MFFSIHVNIMGLFILISDPIISCTIWIENKRSSFPFEIQVKVTDFRRKYHQITTKKLQSNAWFQKTDIASLTVIVWDDHYNTQLLVVDISMDMGANIEVYHKSTEWINWRGCITRKHIGILSYDAVFLWKNFLKLVKSEYAAEKYRKYLMYSFIYPIKDILKGFLQLLVLFHVLLKLLGGLRSKCWCIRSFEAFFSQSCWLHVWGGSSSLEI